MNTNKIKAWLKFVGIFAGLWILFVHIGPVFITKIPYVKEFYQVQEENNIHSGAMYYTNVPVSAPSEEANREAVRKGMAERAAKAAAKQNQKP